MMRFDIAVIGAGVMGSTVALDLARSSRRVCLIDRGAICRAASGVNAGTLTLHMTRAALMPYAMEGWRLWTTASNWLGDDLGVVEAPGLCLAFTDEEVALLEARVQARRDAGAPIRLIEPAEAKTIEPGLSPHVRAAAHCAMDGYASASKTGLAYRSALVDAGAELLENRPVLAVDRVAGGFDIRLADGERLNADRVVLAGGVWLEPMLRWFGLDVPVKTLINQLAVTERRPPAMQAVVTIANGLLSLKQFANGSVLVGGGWQGTGDRERGGLEPIPANLLGNLRLAAWTIPALKDARIVRTWLGLEAETADAMPIAGALPGVPGAFAIGSVHSGYTSGPYIGGLLADLILEREPERPLFPIERLLTPAPKVPA